MAGRGHFATTGWPTAIDHEDDLDDTAWIIGPGETGGVCVA